MTRLTKTHFVPYRQAVAMATKTQGNMLLQDFAKGMAVNSLLQFLTQVMRAQPHCHQQCNLPRLCSVHADASHFRHGAPSDAEDGIPHGFPPPPWH